MKKILSVALCLLLTLAAWAQNADSLAFVSGNWTSSELAEGVVFKQCHFAAGELFGGSNQFVSVVEANAGHPLKVIAAPADTLEGTSSIAARTDAIAAINGSFFKMKYPYGGITYTRCEGYEVVDHNANDGNSVRSERQNGAVVAGGGETFILAADYASDWEKTIEAEEVLTSGPLMITGGCDAQVSEAAFNTNRHPRSAVGKKADGTVVFIVVDGRRPETAGVSIFELRDLMRWMGCVDALNLDGGGSSTLTVGSRIVNMPSDNKKFDNEGERLVANALIIK